VTIIKTSPIRPGTLASGLGSPLVASDDAGREVASSELARARRFLRFDMSRIVRQRNYVTALKHFLKIIDVVKILETVSL
jgi:hypothetical protein